jgi:predicted permease
MTWKYIDVLNECLEILLTIALGGIFGYFRIVEAPSFVPQVTKFVFYVALPCLVIQGLGIGVDFYSDSLLWNFIGVFLALRAIFLVVSLLLVVFDHSKSAGDVAVYWLSFTWIATGTLRANVSV